MFAALILLHCCLKARFPSARGSSGHHLFISAYMISSKVICNDTYLDWELTIDFQFQEGARQDFKENRLSYPNYYPTVLF